MWSRKPQVILIRAYLSVSGDLELLLGEGRLLRVGVHVPPRRDVLQADEVSVPHQLDLHGLVHPVRVQEVQLRPSLGVPLLHQETVVLVLVRVCRNLNKGFRMIVFSLPVEAPEWLRDFAQQMYG